MGRQNTALEQALPYLHVADQDYAKIETFKHRMNVLYTLSVVYHNLAKGYQTVAESADAVMLDGDTSTSSESVQVDKAGLLKKAKEMLVERDRTAEVYLAVEKEQKEAGMMVSDMQLKEMWDLVIKAAAVIGR